MQLGNKNPTAPRIDGSLVFNPNPFHALYFPSKTEGVKKVQHEMYCHGKLPPAWLSRPYEMTR